MTVAALAEARAGRLVGDMWTMEVHEPSNAKPRCRLSILLESGNAVLFAPDTIDQAREDGYDPCPYCIGDASDWRST